MISQKEAQERLKNFTSVNDSLQILRSLVHNSASKTKVPKRRLAESDKTLEYDFEQDYRIERNEIEQISKKLESMDVSTLSKIMVSLAPKLAPYLEKSWYLYNTLPYQRNFYNPGRQPFRSPNNPELHSFSRGWWLYQLMQRIQNFDQDTLWFAAWAAHLNEESYYPIDIGPLLAAAIDSGGPVGDQVVQILMASAKNEHEIGLMGRHVIHAFLQSSRPECWEFIEKMLLAAQREEGLRQVILESVDEAHPEAFRRMLRLILEHNLIRFSSVVRAVDVWFGFLWDSASTGVIKKTLECILEFFDNPDKCQTALNQDDPERVYLALWSIAFGNVMSVLEPAQKLLQHSKPEIRFVTSVLLAHTKMEPASRLLVPLVEDENLCVASYAIDYFRQNSFWDSDLFERLEKVFHRFPKKSEPVKSLVWPWPERKPSRADIGFALLNNIGQRDPVRLISYYNQLNPDTRFQTIKLLRNSVVSPQVRELIIKSLGDASDCVRNEALKAIQTLRLTDEEYLQFELLLTRKNTTLRQAIVALFVNRNDPLALEHAHRLLASKDLQQRLAGLEILRGLSEGNRCREACVIRAQNYKATYEKMGVEEQKQLEFLLKEDIEELTLKDALGLLKGKERTPSELLQPVKVNLFSDAALQLILGLDSFVHEHRDWTVHFKWQGGDGEVLFGNYARYGASKLDETKYIESATSKYVLKDLVEQWWEERPASMRDSDGMEFWRAMLAVNIHDHHESWIGYPQKVSDVYKSNLDSLSQVKVNYFNIVAGLLEYLKKKEIVSETGSKAINHVLDSAEYALSLITEDNLKPSPINRERYLYQAIPDEMNSAIHGDLDYGVCRYLTHACFLKVADRLFVEHQQQWSLDQLRRLWRLSRWWDEPVLLKQSFTEKVSSRIKNLLDKKKEDSQSISSDHWLRPYTSRYRPHLVTLLQAWKAGFATEGDVLDEILGMRESNYDRFDSLESLTRRKTPKEFVDYPGLEEIVDRCRSRIIEVECARGEKSSPATALVPKISSLEGLRYLIPLLSSIGKGDLQRNTSSYFELIGRQASLSHLLRISYPSKDDSFEDFAGQVVAHKISHDRLVELAIFSPQWSAFVEKYLQWDGLEDGVWWIHAHTKDYQFFINPEIREEWQAIISERTPLTGEDLLNGAVDVAWFHKAYSTLGSERWERLYKVAKYTSSGIGHTRARLFSDAMMGQVNSEDLLPKIRNKRNQDSVRALGLLPLDSDPSLREKMILERYEEMQRFLREGKKFGSQRQESERRAVEIGLQNLARTAGYPDPLRLQWAMEAKSMEDLRSGRLTLERGEVSVSLVIDDLGQVDIEILKNDKPLKSIPAALKKDPDIKALFARKTQTNRQSSRIRQSLEQMMCKGDWLRAEEPAALSTHPLLAPMIRTLVFINEKGEMGYPVLEGKALANYRGEAFPAGDRLRLAHAIDLMESQKWHEWQRDCFVRERIQPFKQVFRELYVMTATESEDGTISRRYAGHQVHPRQALALLGGRGWVNQPGEGVRRTFHEADLSVWIEFLEPFYTPAEVEGLTLEGLRFFKRGTFDLIPLREVPPRIFSEVMRDMDLVVSVAHRGEIDPEASAPTIELRTQLIQETMALMKIENVTVEKKHARIQGNLGEYSIHLGSAVCHKMPGGHLFIVPVHAQHRGRLFLPFVDDDPKTAEVISKILLLARDSKIKDPSILEQLH